MTYRPFGGRRPDIDELIHRSLRNQLTDDETDWLAQWRRESSSNEQHYRRSVRLLEAMRRDVGAVRPSPTAQAILSRERTLLVPRRRRASVLVAWVAAAVIIVAVGSAGYALRERAVSAPRTDLPVADGVGYSTGPSEMATVQLSDGSVVRLASNSKLRFVQRLTTREATLEGRAFFAVAKIPGRAFHVHTRLGDATVLGTKFELATESSELRLLVVSGRVGLAGTSNQVEVHAGELSGVHNGTVAEPTRVPNAAKMSDWVGKFLAFQATPMREVAREIEETYGIHVVIQDSVIANRTIVGTFTDRDVRDVIDIVCSVLNAQCVNRPGEVVMTSSELGRRDRP
jgi:ferric-dicitrate binding protein FerR (iron transport regulator)